MNLVGAAVLAACPDDPARRPLGSVCDRDEQCASGLCLEQTCLDPEADDDGDTLINRVEAQVGTSPFDIDSDADGEVDRLELGLDLSILDGDGDGKPDAIESASADGDGDCDADELDGDDADGLEKRMVACGALGVCGADPDGLAFVCGATPVTCDYAAVDGWSARDDDCDARDSDCDGATDEDRVCDGPSDVWSDCRAAAAEGQGSGELTIDPDGAGPEPSQVVACENSTAGGGWTRLGAAWQAWLVRAPASRYPGGVEYLMVAPSGAWIASPATAAGWSWTAPAHLPGLWMTGDAGGAMAAFGCPAGAAQAGVGVGCHGGTTTVVAEATGADATRGGARVCAAVFDGCVDATIWARGVVCAADAGSVAGDGGFTGFVGGDGACWGLEGFPGGGGLGMNLFGDASDAPVAPPSLRAEPYIPAPLEVWYAMVVQGGLRLGDGRAYRLQFAARAEAPRLLVAGLEGGGATGIAPVALTTGWRTFEIPATIDEATLAGAVRFYFGLEEDVDAKVWLDDVRVVDAGAVCTTSVDALLPNGDFDDGLACWDGITLGAAVAGRWYADATGGFEGGPGLAFEAYDASAEATLARLELPLAAGHRYELALRGRTDRARTVRLALMSSGADTPFETQVTLGAEWARHVFQHDVAASASGEPWTLFVVVDAADAGTVRLDDVTLRDLGPIR